MACILPLWVKDSLFYEIFPDRFFNGDLSNDPTNVRPWGEKPTRSNFFGGDLKGILNKLDYLEELKINTIYLTPIFKARTNHKYDTEDYFSIDPSFGYEQTLKSLVSTLHERDMRIILDGVFNHCGDYFWAFKDVLSKGEKSNYKTWFKIRSFPIKRNPPNYKSYGSTGYLPKLNMCNPDVRDYFLKVAKFWITDFGIDGWRLDVPWKVPIEFWCRFRDVVKKANPKAYIVGEIWRDPSFWLKNELFDGVMNYLLRDLVIGYCVLNKMDAEDFDHECNYLRQYVHKEHQFLTLNLLGSHDTARILSICKNNINKLKLALTFIFTYIGAPMIYYGDEIGMEGGKDPDCRRAMIWNKKNWNEKIYHIYKSLIALRKTHPALRSLNFEILFIFEGIFAYRRFFGNDEVVVVFNTNKYKKDIKIPIKRYNSKQNKWRDYLSNKVYDEEEGFINLSSFSKEKALVLLPY